MAAKKFESTLQEQFAEFVALAQRWSRLSPEVKRAVNKLFADDTIRNPTSKLTMKAIDFIGELAGADDAISMSLVDECMEILDEHDQALDEEEYCDE